MSVKPLRYYAGLSDTPVKPLSAATVAAMPVCKLNNDPEWQIVRQAITGHWRTHHIHNLKTLTRYLNRTITLPPMYGLHNRTMTGWNCPLTLRRVLRALTSAIHRPGYLPPQAETDALRERVSDAWQSQIYDYNKKPK